MTNKIIDIYEQGNKADCFMKFNLEGANKVRNGIANELANVIDPKILKHGLINKYIQIVIDMLDVFTQKTRFAGLVDLNEYNEIVYQIKFQETLCQMDLQRVMQWLKVNSPIFGLGCITTKEYHEFLVNTPVPKHVYNYHEVIDVKNKMLNEKHLFVSNKVKPQGPLDPKVFQVPFAQDLECLNIFKEFRL